MNNFEIIPELKSIIIDYTCEPAENYKQYYNEKVLTCIHRCTWCSGDGCVKTLTFDDQCFECQRDGIEDGFLHNNPEYAYEDIMGDEDYCDSIKKRYSNILRNNKGYFFIEREKEFYKDMHNHDHIKRMKF